MKMVAIYIRVSTQEQAKEGYSVSGQEDKLVAYCKAKNWSIYDVYIDGGFSGGNLERPALKNMLNHLSHFDVVLVYRLDRLSRSQRDTLFLIEEKFLRNNVDFVSLSEAFDTTSPFGRAMIGILSVFAQLERETIKERVMLGKEKRAKEGLWRGGGNVPVGYNYIENENRLEVNDYEALQIREIYKLYLEGLGYSKIANKLNQKGYRKGNGTKWYINAIKRVLKNPTYAGYIKYKGELYLGNHEPIISKDIFDKTKNLLNKRSNKKNSMSKYLLSGLLRCGYCGARMKATWITRYKNGPKHYYYICYSAAGGPQHMVKRHNCPGKHISMKSINDYVINRVKMLLLDKDRLINAYYHECKGEESFESITSMKNHLNDIDLQISKLLDLYQYESISPMEISQRISDLKNNKLQIEKSLYEYTNNMQSTQVELEDVLNFIDRMSLIWEEATFEERQTLLKGFIKEVIVENNKIEIIWRVETNDNGSS